MMEKVFRSRGIRLLRNQDGSTQVQQKIYYEPNGCRVDNRQLYSWMEEKVLSFFEYSEVCNKIDTYNFHVKLENDQHKIIYSRLDEQSRALLDVIPSVFDESFQNYTVGYQVEKGEISRSAYYYYPTIWKEIRYGIQGIEDAATISREITRFAEYVASDQQAKDEIVDFGRSMCKLKGISVHFRETLNGYKLYGRCNKSELQTLLVDRMKVDLENYKYGDVILVAQRIQLGHVTGYNLYFGE